MALDTPAEPDGASADSNRLAADAGPARDSSQDEGAVPPDGALDAAAGEADTSRDEQPDVPIDERDQETLPDASTGIIDAEDAPAGSGPFDLGDGAPDMADDRPADVGDDGAPDTAADAGASDGGGSTGDADGLGTDADSGVLGPTWVKIAKRSPKHYYPAVTYDPALQRAVLFGGHTACTENLASNKTWEWDGAAWTTVAPSGKIPSPRGAVTMAFDIAQGEALIHGGWAQPATMQPGNHTYNLGTHTWTTRGSADIILGWYALAYDSDAAQVRMFGGSDGYYFYRQVGAWDAASTTWTAVDPDPPGPTARGRHSWVFDQAHHRFVMFGGMSNWSGTRLADTWEFDPVANTWQQTATEGTRPLDCDAPPPMVYDPHRELVVMYCHTNGGETWEYDTGTHTWTKPVDASEIGLITGASLFYDMKLQSVLLVGGCKSGSLQDGTWQYVPMR